MAPKNIVLKGDPIRKEYAAGGTVTPGFLLTWDGSGDLVHHDVAGGLASPMFAVEQDFLSDNIDEDYASGDEVQYVVGRPGDEIYAMLGDGETVSTGDFLESNGDGRLREHVPQSAGSDGSLDNNEEIVARQIVARVLEAGDTSGSPTETRIRVEVL